MAFWRARDNMKSTPSKPGLTSQKSSAILSVNTERAASLPSRIADIGLTGKGRPCCSPNSYRKFSGPVQQGAKKSMYLKF